MKLEWPDWTEEIVIIVASGPSASEVPLELMKDRARFMAVKDGWRLCPWADVLYGCDHHWWEAHRGIPEFLGLRMAYDPQTITKYRGMPFLKVNVKKQREQFMFGEIGNVGWGGNSGFHAINLVAQFGAKLIALVGFDMRIDNGKHFFGDHKYTKDRPSAPNCLRWAKIIDSQAPVLTKMGITVVNCSLVSTITAFPKVDFRDFVKSVAWGKAA